MSARLGVLEPAHTWLGILCMLAAMAVLPLMDVAAKSLALQGMPVLQIVFLRMIGGTLISAPLVVCNHGAAALLPRDWQLSFKLGGCILGATALFFAALEYLPIAETLAIFFVQPLVVTLLAAFVLRERVGYKRWRALGIGFAATLVIIRPGVEAFSPASLLALGAGTCLALYVVLVRHNAPSSPALVTTYLTHFTSTLLAAPAMLILWQAPADGQMLTGATLAVIGLVGQFLIVKAYEYGEASLLAPLSYTEMITSTLAGWWFFREMPDQITFFGVSVLILCALYVARAGAQQKPRPPVAEPLKEGP